MKTIAQFIIENNEIQSQLQERAVVAPEVKFVGLGESKEPRKLYIKERVSFLKMLSLVLSSFFYHSLVCSSVTQASTQLP